MHGAGFVRHVRQHRQRIVIAAVAEPLSACKHARAFAFGVCDEHLHRLDAAMIGERSHLARRIKSVTDLDALAFSANASVNLP